MKPLTLTFVEQYIDEEPKENYWRGITAHIGEDWVIRMTYYPQKKEFSEPTHFEFDTCLSMSGSDFMEKFRGLNVKTIEEAKTKAQELFNEYVYSLCMDEPDPNGGATTAELMMELGKPIDEALDIHDEVERLADPQERIIQLRYFIEMEMDPFAQICLQKELDEILRNNEH